MTKILREWAGLVVFFLVLAVLENALFYRIQLVGVRLDLSLIITVIYGFSYGAMAGTKAGLASGLVRDLLRARYVGLFILSRMLVGAFSGMLHRGLHGSTPLIPSLATLVGSLTTDLIAFIVLSRPLALGQLVMLLHEVMIPAALGNAVLAYVGYWAYMAVSRRWHLVLHDGWSASQTR